MQWLEQLGFRAGDRETWFHDDSAQSCTMGKYKSGKKQTKKGGKGKCSLLWHVQLNSMRLLCCKVVVTSYKSVLTSWRYSWWD